MVVSRESYLMLLAALVAERAFELWLSRRNTRRALARGGLEVGRAQYRIVVAFHAFFIAACFAEAMIHNAPVSPALSVTALIGETAAQVLRCWSIVTLGESWNTRVIVSPHTPVETSGPYRYVRHPNYCAVVIACMPLLRELVITAAFFSLGNAILLAYRIPLEEQALGECYRRAFAARPRFIPGPVR